MDYQEVLNSQEIFGDELAMFAKKERQKEVGKNNDNTPPTLGGLALSFLTNFDFGAKYEA